MTMQQLGHDLLRATRAVSRSPQFTIAVISVLALDAGVPIVVLPLFSSSVPIVVPVDKESLYEIWRGDKDRASLGFPVPAIPFIRKKSNPLPVSSPRCRPIS